MNFNFYFPLSTNLPQFELPFQETYIYFFTDIQRANTIFENQNLLGQQSCSNL